MNYVFSLHLCGSNINKDMCLNQTTPCTYPRVSHFSTLFFKNKNFDFAIFLRDTSLARFASGLHFQFKCFCLNSCAVACIVFVWKNFALEFGFCSVLFYFFLHKKWANWLRCFCDCENYCILGSVFGCVVRNVLLLHLLCASIFSISCTITLLPYFLQCF